MAMKKLFKKKEKIIEWLEKYRIRNYTLVEDLQYGYVVNVDGHVWLGERNLKQLMVKFNCVTGGFDCSKNKLTTLYGCPQKCNNFACSHNQLKSLQYCPEEVLGGNFDCSNNDLETVSYGPQKVKIVMGLGFNASNNPKIGQWQKAKLDKWLLYQENIKAIQKQKNLIEHILEDKSFSGLKKKI